MIIIHVSNVSADSIPAPIMRPHSCDDLLRFPEIMFDSDPGNIKHMLPLTPREIIDGGVEFFTDYKLSDDHLHIMTTSEHIILLFLYWVRATTDGIEREKSIPVFNLKPSDLQIVLYGHGEPKVLRVNEYGEFIDRWPKPYGFFCERSQLLF